jgi:hypothetical protein
MDTTVKEETYDFVVGDKCIFCQKPILDYGFARNPAPIGDLNKGRCCIHCDKNLVLPIRLGIIEGLEFSYLIKKLYSLGLPKYKNE